MRRKLTSVLLLFVLLFTSVDITAFATEQGTEESAIAETQQTEETGEENEGMTSSASQMQSESSTEKSTEEHSEKTTESEVDTETVKTSENVPETETQTQEKTGMETTETSVCETSESDVRETETESESEIKEIESESESDIKETGTESETETEAETEFIELDADGNIASGVVDEEYGHITWVIDANGKLTVEGTGDFAEPSRSGWDRAPWRNSSFIKSAEINVTGMTDASGMFEQCINMTNVDLSGFDTSKVVSMRSMFYRCYKLESLDLSKFITSNVTLMDRMFMQCEDLKSLNLSGFDTSKVTYMWGMFSGCNSLMSLSISNFDTSKVTSMRAMFDECSSLLCLDLSNFDTSQVTDMSAMFRGCNSLTSLNLSSFDTSHVTGVHNSMEYMFQDCSNLLSLDLSSFNTSQIMDMGGMFSGCSSLTSLDLSSFDTNKVTDMGGMFSGCSSLTSLNLSNFNTSQVAGMVCMFGNCSKLQTLNLNNFDTGEVINMNGMFEDCSSLRELNIKSFNTSKVTNMSNMFEDCKNLRNLDLSNFNTHNVTKMKWMFFGCSNLSELKVSNFDTSKVTDMSEMFLGCGSLNSIDLSSFDTSKVTDMTRMFSGCSKLETMYTPKNVTQSVALPVSGNDVWYRSDGFTVTELPPNLSYSVALGKNYIPEEKPTEVTEATVVEINDGQCAVLVYDIDTKMPVKDACVTIDSNEYITSADGTARFAASDEEEKKQIIVTASNYDKVTTYQKIKSKSLIRIGMEQDTGELRITGAVASLGGSNFDSFREKLVLGYAQKMDDIINLKKDTMQLKVTCNRNNVNYTLFSSDEKIPDGKFKGNIGDAGGSPKTKLLMKSTDGVFTIDVAIETVKIGNVDISHTAITSLIDPKEKLYVLATTNEGSFVRRLNIFTTHNYLTQEKTKQKSSFSFGDEIKITAPEDMPFFGGSEISLGFDEKFPFEVEIDEDGKIKIAYNKPADTKMKDFERKYKSWESSYKNAGKHAARAMDLIGNKSFNAGMVKVSGKVCGYGEGNIKEIVSGNSTIKIGIMAEIEGKAGYKHYWVIGFVPVKIFVEGSIKGGVNVEAETTFENWIPKSFDLTGSGYNLKIELEAGAGVGLSEYIYELEVSLTGSANYDYKPSRDYQKLWLEASGKVQRTALFFWEKSLWESDTYKYTLFENGRDQAKSLAAMPFLDNNAVDADNAFTLMDRKYLNYTDGYNELGQTLALRAVLDDAQQREKSVVKSAVLPSSIPTLVESGSVKYLFWVDDIPSRDDYNRTALMYAKSSNGINWTSPKRLIPETEDNTIDGDYDVFVRNGKIYIVWQDSTRHITAEDSVTDLFKSLSVRYAVLDTANDTVAEGRQLTDIEGAYMYPCTVASGDEAYFAYVHNLLDTGSIDGNNTHRLCLVMPDGAVKEVNVPGKAQITNMDAGVFSGKPSLVCEIDTDGDVSTDSDREIYICSFEDGKLIRITDNNTAERNPVIADSGNIYYIQDNTIIKFSGSTNSSTPIWEESQFTSQTVFTVTTGEDGRDTILWETADISAPDGSVAIFQTSEDADGNWSNVIRFAETTGTIATRISAAGSGESLQVAYTEGSFLADGTKLKDLCVVSRENETDITIEYVDFDENNATAGNMLTFKVGVINNGNTTVNDLNAVINGKKIATLTGIELKPYESRELEVVGFQIPADLKESTQFTFELTAPDETSLDDNAASFMIGCPDVYTETDYRIENGRTQLDVSIMNDTSYEASGKIIVHKGYEKGEIIFSKDYKKTDAENGYAYSFDLGDYEDDYTKYYVEITSNTEEYNTANNTAFVYIGYGTGVEQEEKEEVTYEITSIALNSRSTLLGIGDNVHLSVCDNQGNSLSAREILWTTGDKRIANVDQEGLVTAYRTGTTQITAYYGELSCSCTVTVGEEIEVQHLTVQFDTQGGNDITPITGIVPGSTVHLPTNVKKVGYTFDGWYTQPTGGNKVSGTITVTENITLYAHWIKEVQPEEPSTEPQTESEITPPTESETEPETDPETVPSTDPSDTENQGNGLWISGISKTGYPYTGEPMKPAVKVYDKTTLLTEKTDYTISYKNNTKAGKATITVTGRGNYSGKETITFDILPADIGSEEVYAMDFYVKIGKKAQKPIPELYYMGTKLKNNKDFTISYANTSNVYAQTGEYSVTITGKGNYKGTRVLKLMAVEKIVKPKPVSIAKAALNGFAKSFTYTGKACRQECKLTVKTSEGEKILTEGMDYTVQYANNIKAGTATVTYYGRNRYTGKLKKTYKILPYDILSDPISKIKYENNVECIYAKGGSKPKPVVTFEGKALKEGVDYTLSYKNNQAVYGNQTPCVIVNGTGCFKGKIPINFTLKAQNLSKMTLVSGDKVYKNKANIYKITPKLMDMDGRLLSAGKDFDPKSMTYVYENDVVLENGVSRKAGSGVEKTDIIPADTQIRITLNCGNGGNYIGDFTGTYRITKADIKSAEVAIPKQIYTGNEILLDKSQITVKLSGVILNPEDYEIVRYDNNVKKGTASVTIRGTRNYGGIKTAKFTISTKGLLWWWRK